MTYGPTSNVSTSSTTNTSSTSSSSLTSDQKVNKVVKNNKVMKKFIWFLLVLFVMPTFASTRSYYLILSKRGTGLERIEMATLDECEKLGKQWDQVSGGHTYTCLEGNK